MEAIRETTDWAVPGHTYLLDGTTLVAYIKKGTTEPIHFGKGIKGFDRRGRTFEKADVSLFETPEAAAEAAPGDQLVEVKGSKGNSYYVNIEEATCTCPGYTFRGRCKHTEELCN
jgi:hypothetical protein